MGLMRNIKTISEVSKEIKKGTKEFGNKTVKKCVGKVETSLKEKRMKSFKEYKRKEGKNYLYFERPMLYMLNEFTDCGGIYNFYNLDEKIKYSMLAESEFEYKVIDINSNIVGNIKNHILTMRFPLIQKRVKKCSVIRNEEKLCGIKKYVELGYLEFDTIEGKISLSCNDKKNIYKIKKGSKILASVKKIDKKSTDIIYNHYVIEYDNKEDEEIIVLMTCTIFILMSDEEI